MQSAVRWKWSARHYSNVIQSTRDRWQPSDIERICGHMTTASVNNIRFVTDSVGVVDCIDYCDLFFASRRPGVEWTIYWKNRFGFPLDLSCELREKICKKCFHMDYVSFCPLHCGVKFWCLTAAKLNPFKGQREIRITIKYWEATVWCIDSPIAVLDCNDRRCFGYPRYWWNSLARAAWQLRGSSGNPSAVLSASRLCTIRHRSLDRYHGNRRRSARASLQSALYNLRLFFLMHINTSTIRAYSTISGSKWRS